MRRIVRADLASRFTPRPAGGGGGICDDVAVVGGIDLSHNFRRRTPVVVVDRVRQVETARSRGRKGQERERQRDKKGRFQ